MKKRKSNEDHETPKDDSDDKNEDGSRRARHNEAEKRRRHKISDTYQDLARMIGCSRTQKAFVLRSAINRIDELQGKIKALGHENHVLGGASKSSSRSRPPAGSDLNGAENGVDYKRVFLDTAIPVAVLDLAGTMIDCNPALAALLGSTSERLFEDAMLAPRQSCNLSIDHVHRILSSQKASHRQSMTLLKASGAVVAVESTAWLCSQNGHAQISAMYAAVPTDRAAVFQLPSPIGFGQTQSESSLDSIFGPREPRSLQSSQSAPQLHRRRGSFESDPREGAKRAKLTGPEDEIAAHQDLFLGSQDPPPVASSGSGFSSSAFLDASPSFRPTVSRRDELDLLSGLDSKTTLGKDSQLVDSILPVSPSPHAHARHDPASQFTRVTPHSTAEVQSTFSGFSKLSNGIGGPSSVASLSAHLMSAPSVRVEAPFEAAPQTGRVNPLPPNILESFLRPSPALPYPSQQPLQGQALQQLSQLDPATMAEILKVIARNSVPSWPLVQTPLVRPGLVPDQTPQSADPVGQLLQEYLATVARGLTSRSGEDQRQPSGTQQPSQLTPLFVQGGVTPPQLSSTLTRPMSAFPAFPRSTQGTSDSPAPPLFVPGGVTPPQTSTTLTSFPSFPLFPTRPGAGSSGTGPPQLTDGQPSLTQLSRLLDPSYNPRRD